MNDTDGGILSVSRFLSKSDILSSCISSTVSDGTLPNTILICRWSLILANWYNFWIDVESVWILCCAEVSAVLRPNSRHCRPVSSTFSTVRCCSLVHSMDSLRRLVQLCNNLTWYFSHTDMDLSAGCNHYLVPWLNSLSEFRKSSNWIWLKIRQRLLSYLGNSFDFFYRSTNSLINTNLSWLTIVNQCY